MLETTYINRVDQFASVAEILARENRGWWSQLYLGMKPTFGAHLRGMKPTEYVWSQLHICVELQSSFDMFYSVKVASKWGKPIDHDLNVISYKGGQDKSACPILGHSLHAF